MPVDYKSLEDAYNSAVIGKNPPELIACTGSFILKYRPDLVGSIDPNKVYHVTAEEIAEVDDAG